jgi:hypothetical protein
MARVCEVDPWLTSTGEGSGHWSPSASKFLRSCEVNVAQLFKDNLRFALPLLDRVRITKVRGDSFAHNPPCTTDLIQLIVPAVHFNNRPRR